MPSSFSFLLNRQTNSSRSSSENDSKSDQSDTDDNGINGDYSLKRTIQNENDMLERPSDHDDSCSQSDVSDNNDDDDDEKNDLLTSTNNNRAVFLTRQATLYADDWPKKRSSDENETRKVSIDGEATILDNKYHEKFFLDTNSNQLFSSERSKSGGIVDKKYHSQSLHTPLTSDFTTTTIQQFHSNSDRDNMKTALPRPQTKINSNTSSTRLSTMNKDVRQSISKIPVRTNSPSQSRSRSPTLKAATATKIRRAHSPTSSSKIPVPVSTTSKGAFRFFTSADRSGTSQVPSTTNSGQAATKTNTQVSPFTPITHRKIFSSPQKLTSSAGNTPSAKQRRSQLAISDDEDESETSHLEEQDLKLKLKEQKRYGKKTGELLNKLHENYEELLEKYAQAENTIDQLRFQPKITDDHTPSSNASEGTIHFIHQSRVNVASVRSSGVYHSTTVTPLSSIMHVASSSTTAATNTPAIKKDNWFSYCASPTNSATAESVIFDESVPQTITVQELTTPETIKLDLLIQTKTLGGKMKSFLTLMDANQLSLAEQKQVYDTIKEDYEKLLKVFDRSKRGSDFSDVDFDADLNSELEMMKQLLKEIVNRITDNLLGKSSNGIEIDRQSRGTQSETHSSQVSARSSICNHADLMDQYQKLLNAVNAGISEKKNETKSSHVRLDNQLEQTKKTSSQLDLPNQIPTTTKSQKQYVHHSEHSDDDQQKQTKRTTPVPLKKDVHSTSFELVLNSPTTTNHHYLPPDERQFRRQQDIQNYDNLENIAKSQRKHKVEQRKNINHYQLDNDMSPPSLSNGTNGPHYSTRSMRTRTSDYDSGIGTNNTTKLSRDSKLNTSMIDESHYQSLDDDRRRYTDEEQETMSNVSSSHSNESDTVSPGMSYNKYTKRFDTLSSVNESYRRVPSGRSDLYPSDIETFAPGSFDQTPQTSAYKRKPRRSHPNLQFQQTASQRTRLTPYHRSISTDSVNFRHYQNSSHRPQTAPQDPSKLDQHHKMGRKYRSGIVHRQTTISSSNPEKMYRSACYIDESHTHRRSQEKLNQHQRQAPLPPTLPPPPTTITRKQTSNLYLDPHTGVLYRYVPNKNQPSTTTLYQPTSSQTKSPSTKLHACTECGCMTTYHHRHHTHPTVKRTPNDIDDPGYESGNKRMNRYRQDTKHITSSDSESEEISNSYDMAVLNEAYERAKKVQHHSQTLSRHISRQLKLILATI
ncbi:hypothetical protein I4U23_019321 [Adineta vaga]|nr:hypothetical protein I4U23_019321 [Adineta vaga]